MKKIKNKNLNQFSNKELAEEVIKRLKINPKRVLSDFEIRCDELFKVLRKSSK